MADHSKGTSLLYYIINYGCKKFYDTGPKTIASVILIYSWVFHITMKYLNLEHFVQNISFLNMYENVLRLMKYHCKFHLFLKVKDEMLQSWHSHNSLIFLQSLYYFIPQGCIQGMLTKGKFQYSWPPCTYWFRSATFDITNIIYFFTKQATLIRRPTVLSPPLWLVNPAAPYTTHSRTLLTTTHRSILCCF